MIHPPKTRNQEKNIVKQLKASTHKRVVCIDATKIDRTFHAPGGRIRRGQVYHVAAITNGAALLLLGKPVFDADDGEIGWRADRFKVIA